MRGNWKGRRAIYLRRLQAKLHLALRGSPAAAAMSASPSCGCPSTFTAGAAIPCDRRDDPPPLVPRESVRTFATRRDVYVTPLLTWIGGGYLKEIGYLQSPRMYPRDIPPPSHASQMSTSRPLVQL